MFRTKIKEESNPYAIFKQEDEMPYYKYFKDPRDRKRAWTGFEHWLDFPIWFATPEMKGKMFSELVKSEYFFPTISRDLVLKLFEKSAERIYRGDYFMMVRLSQASRPLVWTLITGGTETKKLTQVRIGVGQISSTALVPRYIIYTVVLGQLEFQSKTLKGMVEFLRAHYIKETPAYPWPSFFTQERNTVKPASTTHKVSVGQNI